MGLEPGLRNLGCFRWKRRRKRIVFGERKGRVVVSHPGRARMEHPAPAIGMYHRLDQAKSNCGFLHLALLRSE